MSSVSSFSLLHVKCSVYRRNFFISASAFFVFSLLVLSVSSAPDRHSRYISFPSSAAHRPSQASTTSSGTQQAEVSSASAVPVSPTRAAPASPVPPAPASTVPAVPANGSQNAPQVYPYGSYGIGAQQLNEEDEDEEVEAPSSSPPLPHSSPPPVQPSTLTLEDDNSSSGTPVSPPPSSSSSSSSPPRQEGGRAKTYRGEVLNTSGGGASRITGPLDFATVQQIADMEPKFAEFGKLMKSIGATFMIEQSRDITVFMPTSEALREAPADVNSLSWEEKWDIFNYLVIPEQIKFSETVPGEYTYESLYGEKLRVSVPSDKTQPIMLNDVAIVSEELENFNGISYTINELVLPKKYEAELANTDNDNDDDNNHVNSGGLSTEDGDGEAPEFLQQTNAAHDQWNSVLQKKFATQKDEDNSSDEAGEENGLLDSNNDSHTGLKEDIGEDGNEEVGGLIQALSMDQDAIDEIDDEIPQNYGWAPTQVGWQKPSASQIYNSIANSSRRRSSVRAAGIDTNDNSNSESNTNPTNPLQIEDIKRTENDEGNNYDSREDEEDEEEEYNRRTSLHEEGFDERVAPIKTLGYVPGLLPHQELVSSAWRNKSAMHQNSMPVRSQAINDDDKDDVEGTEDAAAATNILNSENNRLNRRVTQPSNVKYRSPLQSLMTRIHAVNELPVV